MNTNERMFIEKLYNKHSNIKIIGAYKHSRIKTKFLCMKCNETFKQTPGEIVRSLGCPYCNNYKLSQTEFIKRIEKIHNKNITILGKYKGTRKKVLVKCNKCNNKWKTLSKCLLDNKGCPNCNRSKGENKIDYILKNNDIYFISQYKIKECKNINPLPFDFAVFDDKQNLLFLIEYQGEQHYKPVDYFGGEESFKKQKERDNIKRNYCKKYKIDLLTISYKEYDNIERILQEKLKDYTPLYNTYFLKAL